MHCPRASHLQLARKDVVAAARFRSACGKEPGRVQGGHPWRAEGGAAPPGLHPYGSAQRPALQKAANDRDLIAEDMVDTMAIGYVY